ncbi:MAG: ABC transporter ATP-binding protein [Actinomycetota bacterium]|nr:ABC transporter ATP-binding protein [Actinomycetota bacterium]
MSASATVEDPAAAAEPAEPSPVIDARCLYRFYHAGDEEVLALRGVSLQVFRGEMVAVVGPSGSGKSTLLACLAGLDDPDGGQVYVAGTRISRVGERQRARLRVEVLGVLLQSGNLVGHLSIADNVALVRRLAGRRDRSPVSTVLGRLGLEDRGSALPSALSGGELARAGLAVALANDPPVVLADEPTGELDGRTEADVADVLVEQAREGRAVVVVTHSTVIAARADRIVTLADGVVVVPGGQS